MKIALVILGTRGDVQPMIALATGLMKNGHEVIIYAPPENEELARQNDCQFVPFGPGIKKLVEEKPEGQKGGVVITISPKQATKLFGDQMNLLPLAAKFFQNDLGRHQGLQSKKQMDQFVI